MKKEKMIINIEISYLRLPNSSTSELIMALHKELTSALMKTFSNYEHGCVMETCKININKA